MSSSILLVPKKVIDIIEKYKSDILQYEKKLSQTYNEYVNFVSNIEKENNLSLNFKLYNQNKNFLLFKKFSEELINSKSILLGKIGLTENDLFCNLYLEIDEEEIDAFIDRDHVIVDKDNILFSQNITYYKTFEDYKHVKSFDDIY